MLRVNVMFILLLLYYIVRAGITVYCRGHYCNESDAKPFLNLFSLTGVCEEVLEKHINALSAVSGSGVAFVSLLHGLYGPRLIEIAESDQISHLVAMYMQSGDGGH